ncbi:Zinc finger RING/FYVE/PHD-type protein [Dioscorea alata]|uniref:Zinc finger RING/FYVE/PHD-type protein n=1 Tax=Dioscorea alata TaxID=55571 RepID=A0ACB7VSL7_DIOAL|nr:Zinc finger RING/FYVE/PHD-type protein [Dioscorea alata]
MEITTLLFHLFIAILVVHGISLLLLLKILVSKYLIPLLPLQMRVWPQVNFHQYSCPHDQKISLKLLREIDQLSSIKLCENSSEVECVVCMATISNGEEIRELKCRHLFHKACLDGWLEHGQATCPLCRSSLLSAGAMTAGERSRRRR